MGKSFFVSLLCLAFCGINAMGQSYISYYEYWIDDSTQYHIKEIEHTDSTTIGFSIATNELSKGVHSLSIRVKDNNNNWSPFTSMLFIVPGRNGTDIYAEKVEYWFDNASSIHTIRIDNGEAVFAADASGLSDGIHILNCRLYNNDGIASATQSWTFAKLGVTDTTRQIISGEYWLDDRFADKKSVPVSDNIMAFTTNTAALNNGLHTLNYRLKDSHNIYSSIQSWTFAKLGVTDTTRQIISGEYWLDDSFADKKSVPVSDNIMAFTANTAALNNGLHTLNYRLKDSHNIYSSTDTWLFIKSAVSDSLGDEVIKYVDYWFDSQFTSRETQTMEGDSINFFADASSLEEGLHTISYRIRDNYGSYSDIRTWAFFKETSPAANKIAYCKYWWNNNTDKAIREDNPDTGLEYTWIKELVVPEYAKADGFSTKSTAKLNIVFVDDAGNSSPMLSFDIDYPDHIPPVSTIEITEQSSEQVSLKWYANEDEIEFYNIYVSENDRPFVLWMPNTTASTATFKIKDGVSYKFLSTARDKAGNMEKYDESKSITITDSIYGNE